MLQINRITAGIGAQIYAKLERFNPNQSIKERVALGMIEAAERADQIKPGETTLIEATSGNTGIGLALIAAARGYRLIIVMPDSASLERRAILRAHGAEVRLTPAVEGMTGAVARAKALVAAGPGRFSCMQFDNPANPAAHAQTADEIWESMEGRVDAFVAAVGTGGTMTGVGRRLRALNPRVRLIALEPAESPVLSGGPAAPHPIQGMGAGFISAIMDRQQLDEILAVSGAEALEMTRRLAREEGLLMGISSGAALAGAIKVAARLAADKRVATIFPDAGDRYLSGAPFGA